jgi:ABC-2 type transport system permease protein
MRNIIILAKKELMGYFNSLIAYTVIVVFLLISGYLFVSPLFVMKEATIKHFISLMPMLYLFFIPAVTMRLFSEEIKSGTIEILFTQPVEDHEILLGKYLASLIFLIIALACTVFYSLSLLFVGSPDFGRIVSSYIGLVLLGGAFISAGIFASALTKNQIISFIVTFVVCFMFFMMGKITALVPPVFANIIDYAGIDSHYENIARGIIDTRDIIYYFSIITFFLYSALCVIKGRK